MALAADWLIGRLETFVSATTGTHMAAASGRRAQLRRRVLFAASALVLVACVVAFVTWRSGRRQASSTTQTGAAVVICSKDFTESVLLAELLAQELEAQGAAVERKLNSAATSATMRSSPDRLMSIPNTPARPSPRF